jgi:tetratricopeptide (TPR) repeat protein
VVDGRRLAEIPLPSWREELLKAEWAAIDQQIEASCVKPRFLGQAVTCREESLKAAIQRAERFQSEVAEDGGLEYLVGLAWRYLGDVKKAEKHYRRATELRPDDRGAWYDLGEMYLASARWTDAEEAFEHVSALMVDDPQAWIGPWRLAEVAAHQGDAAKFERHMKEALRRGFTFQTIAGLPNWKAFYADPRIRDSLEKLVTVYGDRKVLDSLAP